MSENKNLFKLEETRRKYYYYNIFVLFILLCSFIIFI